MELKTERLTITKLAPSMAESIHLQSLDEDTRRFLPDEVFETKETARETVDFLVSRYETSEGPFVCSILQNGGEMVGYVQLCRMENGWEIGYHIGRAYRRRGYAAEAVGAFVPYVMDTMGLDAVYGICVTENRASQSVMQRCGFVKIFEGIGQYHGVEQRICRFVYRK